MCNKTGGCTYVKGPKRKYCRLKPRKRGPTPVSSRTRKMRALLAELQPDHPGPRGPNAGKRTRRKKNRTPRTPKNVIKLRTSDPRKYEVGQYVEAPVRLGGVIQPVHGTIVKIVGPDVLGGGIIHISVTKRRRKRAAKTQKRGERARLLRLQGAIAAELKQVMAQERARREAVAAPGFVSARETRSSRA